MSEPQDQKAESIRNYIGRPGDIMPGDPVFTCEDAPRAGGRTAVAGDFEYRFWFVLEDGRTLHLIMGREGRNRFRGFLVNEDLDDFADEAAKRLDEPATQ